jgi:hypothetical protein
MIPVIQPVGVDSKPIHSFSMNVQGRQEFFLPPFVHLANGLSIP